VSVGYFHCGRDELRRVRSVGDLQLVFSALGPRQERTGFHAEVRIAVGGVTLAYDTFNVGRDADRTRLANSAYTKLIGGRPSKARPERPDYPLTYLKDDLDQFCDGLRDAYLDDLAPLAMAGALERSEPQFVLKPYILQDGGTIAFAPPGFGKSYVLWTMGVSIDAGVAELWPVQQSRVLVVNLERSAKSVANRLGNINEILGLDRERPIDTINARGRTLQEVAPTIQRYLDRNGNGCILVDSLSRAGPGSLNDDDVVNAYCNTLNSFGAAWFALAHSPRADPTHLFGSQMFDAAADLIVRMMAQEKLRGPMGVALDLIKRNDVAKHPMWIGAFDFDAAGLFSIRRARPGEFVELEASEKMSMEDRVWLHLTRMGAQSPSQIARDLDYNRTNISDMLSRNDRFVLVGTKGREHLYGVKLGNTSGRATGGQREEPWWTA